jgi:host factor-I protein
MNRPQLNLQDTFLNQARKENVSVSIWLNNQRQLRGNVRGFDAFTILLDSPGQPPQLVYKHSISSIVPMRPLQNVVAEAMKDAGLSQPQPPHQATAPAAPQTPTQASGESGNGRVVAAQPAAAAEKAPTT